MHALISQGIKTTGGSIEGHKYGRGFNWKSQYNTIGFCGQVDFFNLFVTSLGRFWRIFLVKDLVVIFVVLFLLLVNNKTQSPHVQGFPHMGFYTIQSGRILRVCIHSINPYHSPKLYSPCSLFISACTSNSRYSPFKLIREPDPKWTDKCKHRCAPRG